MGAASAVVLLIEKGGQGASRAPQLSEFTLCQCWWLADGQAAGGRTPLKKTQLQDWTGGGAGGVVLIVPAAPESQL